MRSVDASRPIVYLFALALGSLAACGSAVSGADGGADVTRRDAASDGTACGPMPPASCAYGDANGVCGDVIVQMTCTSGAWACPAGTIDTSRCMCFGSMPTCVCRPGGWQCPPQPDAGPPGCPPDLAAAEGTPCSEEGRSCGGPCTDPCSFCNILRCERGRWSRLEAPPDPSCSRDAGADPFACGTRNCVHNGEYCYVILDDTGGPDVYQCRPLPAACAGMPSCECVAGAPAGSGCRQSAAGDVTLTVGGG